jgi:hypothetical protein
MKMFQKLFGKSSQKDTGSDGGTPSSHDSRYEDLDRLWEIRDTSDGRMHVTFITYLSSKGDLLKTFRELSFADIDGERVSLRDGIKSTASVFTDRNNVVLVFLTGRFEKQQAREVISTLSRHADHTANSRYLAESAASFSKQLQEKGGGTVVWVDWG